MFVRNLQTRVSFLKVLDQRDSMVINVSLLSGETGSFGKLIVAVCDYEKQFFGAIIRCALGKRASAFCLFLPSPIKRCPRQGLYKEGILKSFRFFYRSHYSFPNQRNEFLRRRRPFLVSSNISFLAFFLTMQFL
jgi:hypothetical protein